MWFTTSSPEGLARQTEWCVNAFKTFPITFVLVLDNYSYPLPSYHKRVWPKLGLLGMVIAIAIDHVLQVFFQVQTGSADPTGLYISLGIYYYLGGSMGVDLILTVHTRQWTIQISCTSTRRLKPVRPRWNQNRSLPSMNDLNGTNTHAIP